MSYTAYIQAFVCPKNLVMIDYECDNCDDDVDCDAYDDYDDSPGDACAQEAQGRGVGGLSRPGSVKKA